MKKTLYILAAMSMVASTAMASKARLNALGNSQVAFDSDVQGIFQNPSYMHYVGDFVTFEMGERVTSAAAASDNEKFVAFVGGTHTPNAEGGFITTMGDAKFGAYLGKMSVDTNSFRVLAKVTGALGANDNFLPQENPIELFYGAKMGDMNWGASFSYSNSNKEKQTGSADDEKQNAMGVRMGVRTDDWAAFANVGLGSKATVGDAEVKGTSGILLGGHYMMDTMRVYGIYQGSGAKAKDATGTDVMDATVTETSLGFTNAWKNEGNLAFYDISYKMDNRVTKTPTAGTKETKVTTTTLPVTLGAEMAATSWMKLRGSVTQNVLLGSTKETKDGTGEANTIDHNTVTAAGAGFVWGRNNLDLVLSMGTSGDVKTDDFGTQASYTYLF